MVATAVAECVRTSAEIVEQLSKAQLKNGYALEEHVKSLQDNVKKARFWHGESRHEGLIWTTLWEGAYEADLVSSILDRCDEVQVALYGIDLLMERTDTSNTVLSTRMEESIKEALPVELASRSFLHARFTQA